MKEIPIWEKSNLTLKEAAVYSGIGVNKLRELTNERGCKFVLWNGNKRLIKRKELDKFTDWRRMLVTLVMRGMRLSFVLFL